MLAPRVFTDAYKIWSLLRGCKYSDSTWKLLLFWKTGSEKRWSIMRGGCNQQLYFEGKRKQNIGKFKNKSWMSPKDSEFISNNPLHSLSTAPDFAVEL